MAKYRWNPDKQEWEEDVLVSDSALVKGIIFLLIIGGIYSCYDATIGRRIDISDVNKYCSAEQLRITGQAKCTEVKRKLSIRYIQELKRDKNALENLKGKVSSLTKDKQEKCSPNGLNEYGTEGCSTATKNLENNNGNIIKLAQEVNHKQHEIASMQIFSLYKVNASSLNVRDCNKTSCKVIMQLQSGQEIYAEDGNDEWMRVLTEKGQGYVVKKYLLPIINYEIKVDFGDQFSNKQSSESIVLENNYKDMENQSGDAKNNTSTEVVIDNPKNLSPLASAIISNNRENIINLIKNGADVNEMVSCDDYNYENACFSILRLAAKYLNDPELIKTIINSGAKTDAVSETGLTEIEVAAFDAAEHNKNVNVLKLLLDYGVPATISEETYNLLMAASSNNSNPEVIIFLIDKGLNVNAIDMDGNTPLMYAAMSNQNHEIINTLVKRVANTNARNMNDISAIDYAASENQDPKILEALINSGATFDENILTLAQKNKNQDVTTILKKHFENKTNDKSSIFKEYFWNMLWLILAFSIPGIYKYFIKLKSIFQRTSNSENISIVENIHRSEQPSTVITSRRRIIKSKNTEIKDSVTKNSRRLEL